MSNILCCWPTSCLSKSHWRGCEMTRQKSGECSLNATATIASYFKPHLIELELLHKLLEFEIWNFQFLRRAFHCVHCSNEAVWRLNLERWPVALSEQHAMCWLRSSQANWVDLTPFRFIPFAHILCRRVKRKGVGGPFVWELMGELWHLCVKTTKVSRGHSRLSQIAQTGREVVITQPQGRVTVTSKFTTGLLHPNTSHEVSCRSRTTLFGCPFCLSVLFRHSHSHTSSLSSCVFKRPGMESC